MIAAIITSSRRCLLLAMMTAMILGIDPKIDYAFKLLPGQEGTEALLIDVLNGVLQRPEGVRVENVKILYPFNPKAAYDDKLSIVDVRARDQSGPAVQC